jgi:hypothetical protein
VLGPVLAVARRFENVHPDDQSILEAIAVANAGVGDELSGARVVDDLMDIDRDPAVGLLREALRFDLARDCRELPVPIAADSRPADYPTALPGIGPIDLWVHELDRGLNVAGVESAIGGSQSLLRAWHETNLSPAFVQRRRMGGVWRA